MRLFALFFAWAAVSHAADSVRLGGAFESVAEPVAMRIGSAPGKVWHSANPDGRAVGRLELPLPALPANLVLNTAGYPNHGTLRLTLQSPDGSRELKLGFRSPPGPDWTLHRWSLPPGWHGQPAVLVARDESTEQWIGVGLVVDSGPWRRANWSAIANVLGATALTVLPFFTALILLRPGFGSDGALRVALALVGSGLFAFAVFLGFYLSRALGNALLIAGGCAALFAVWRLWRARVGRWPDLTPLAATFLLAVAFAGATCLYGGAQSAYEIPSGRHDLNLPSDNWLPEHFAGKIHNRQPLQPFIIDWLTSDRPPLQAGYLLQSRPLLSGQSARLAAAIACQLAVYAGLWVLLAAAAIPQRQARLCLLVCATSGFFLVNTVFAWPKLLPAGFLLAIAGLLHRVARERRRATPAEIFTMSACAALAMLGHGGSFFGLAALGLVHLAFHSGWKDIRLLMGGAAMAGAIYAPWAAYQKLADPPGDRLIKYHLAGRTAVDLRGSLTVIAEAYRQTPGAGIVRNKLSNLRVLAGDFTNIFPSLARAFREAADGEWRRAWWRTANAVQGGAFFHLLQSPGVLTVGLAGLWFGRKKSRAWTDPGWYCIQLAAASVVVWCALMFGPEGTIVHTGTYLTGALLHVACALGLFAFGHAAGRWLVLGLHFALFVGIWILSPTWNPWQDVHRPGLDHFWLVVLLLSGGALLWVGRKLPVGSTEATAATR